MDVYGRRLSGLEHKLICSFKLSAEMIWGGGQGFIYYEDKPPFLTRNLMRFRVIRYWYVNVKDYTGELVSIHMCFKNIWPVSPMQKTCKVQILYTRLEDLQSARVVMELDRLVLELVKD